MKPVPDDAAKILLESVFDTLKEFFRPNMTFDVIAEKYSPSLDDIIEKYQKEGLTYSAGKFKVAYFDEKSFTLGFELYFQDAAKKWSKVARTSKPYDAKKWLAPETWLELKNIKEKVFDVDAPEPYFPDDKKF